MDLREVFTPAAIAANWTEVASNQIPYLGATLCPKEGWPRPVLAQGFPWLACVPDALRV